MQHEVAKVALAADPTLSLLVPPKRVIARTLIDMWLNSNSVYGGSGIGSGRGLRFLIDRLIQSHYVLRMQMLLCVHAFCGLLFLS